MRPRDLFDWLGRDDAEDVAVLSVVLDLREGGQARLLHGSMVLAPRAAGVTGWPGWRHSEGARATPDAADAVPAEFAIELGEVLVGRAVMLPAEAVAWCTALITGDTAPPAGPLPACEVALRPARAPVLVCADSETDAGAFATDLARPLTGFLFRVAEPVGPPVPPDEWPWQGTTIRHAGPTLLGLSWFATRTTPMVQGLFIARVERRAWLAGHRLLKDGHFVVDLALDPERVELADLELVVEERADGETIWSGRLRLEDMDLTNCLDESRVSLTLPSIGWGGVQRLARLHHRDGTLLDAWRPFMLLESIHMTMTVTSPDGQNAHSRTHVIGRDGPDLVLVDLLAAAERVKREFVSMRRTGLSARLIDDPAVGMVALRRLLERGQGEVLVMDPYLRDWPLVDGLPSGPARVLIGARVDGPPPGFSGRAKQWRATKQHDIAPFHDRFFLWEGGGVAVGTSAGPGGRRFFRIARIDAIEASELRESLRALVGRFGVCRGVGSNLERGGLAACSPSTPQAAVQVLH